MATVDSDCDVKDADGTAVWKWVHYGVSFHTYSFRVFMYNEFHCLELNPNNVQYPTGEQVLLPFVSEPYGCGADFYQIDAAAISVFGSYPFAQCVPPTDVHVDMNA